MDHIAEGITVNKACAAVGLSVSAFRRLVRADPALAAEYAAARREFAETHFDSLMDLAQDCLDGVIAPQAFRAAVGAKKWVLERMRSEVRGIPPGGDGETERSAAVLADLSGLTPDQLLELARLAFAGDRERPQ